ncbi:unnamed protein product [Prorocentrum cordatum]|uniref:Uncharacterized protein n=1 Tax=Prorocentrum cordatum TaxID=2364126 RepID=A0ABN9PYP5_9DINO|nr:unnamed protein product [Polarella glacialis]
MAGWPRARGPSATATRSFARRPRARGAIGRGKGEGTIGNDDEAMVVDCDDGVLASVSFEDQLKMAEGLPSQHPQPKAGEVFDGDMKLATSQSVVGQQRGDSAPDARPPPTASQCRMMGAEFDEKTGRSDAVETGAWSGGAIYQTKAADVDPLELGGALQCPSRWRSSDA